MEDSSLKQSIEQSQGPEEIRKQTLEAIETAKRVLQNVKKEQGEESHAYKKTLEDYNKLKEKIIDEYLKDNSIVKSELVALRGEINNMGTISRNLFQGSYSEQLDKMQGKSMLEQLKQPEIVSITAESAGGELSEDTKSKIDLEAMKADKQEMRELPLGDQKRIMEYIITSKQYEYLRYISSDNQDDNSIIEFFNLATTKTLSGDEYWNMYQNLHYDDKEDSEIILKVLECIKGRKPLDEILYQLPDTFYDDRENVRNLVKLFPENEKNNCFFVLFQKIAKRESILESVIDNKDIFPLKENAVKYLANGTPQESIDKIIGKSVYEKIVGGEFRFDIKDFKEKIRNLNQYSIKTLPDSFWIDMEIFISTNGIERIEAEIMHAIENHFFIPKSIFPLISEKKNIGKKIIEFWGPEQFGNFPYDCKQDPEFIQTLLNNNRVTKENIGDYLRLINIRPENINQIMLLLRNKTGYNNEKLFLTFKELQDAFEENQDDMENKEIGEIVEGVKKNLSILKEANEKFKGKIRSLGESYGIKEIDDLIKEIGEVDISDDKIRKIFQKNDSIISRYFKGNIDNFTKFISELKTAQTESINNTKNESRSLEQNNPSKIFELYEIQSDGKYELKREKLKEDFQKFSSQYTLENPKKDGETLSTYKENIKKAYFAQKGFLGLKEDLKAELDVNITLIDRVRNNEEFSSNKDKYIGYITGRVNQEEFDNFRYQNYTEELKKFSEEHKQDTKRLEVNSGEKLYGNVENQKEGHSYIYLGENKKVEITNQEASLIQNNETAKENLLHFYSVLQDCGLEQIWSQRESIFKAISNQKGMAFDTRDGDYLSKNEVKIFLQTVIKSIAPQFKNQGEIETILNAENEQDIIYFIKNYNGENNLLGPAKDKFGRTKLVEIFNDTFFPQEKQRVFQFAQFESAIRS